MNAELHSNEGSLADANLADGPPDPSPEHCGLDTAVSKVGIENDGSDEAEEDQREVVRH
jgi:hypothetical protein